MLRDCFTPCFLLMLRLPGLSPEERAELRREALVRLDAAASLARRQWDAATVETARCLMEAWMDEIALNLAWEGRMAWLRDPLQGRWHKGRQGGDWFFATTGRLLPDNANDKALAGLALRCLGLGFQGNMYANTENLRREHQRLATVFGCTAPVQDFPPLAHVPPPQWRRYAWPLCTGIVAAVLLASWLMGNWALNTNYADNKALPCPTGQVNKASLRLPASPMPREWAALAPARHGMVYGELRGRVSRHDIPRGGP